jgi:uncharacterized Zn finger protein
VPVAERRRKAAKKMEALRKKGVDVQPVTIDGRKIAKSFWGQSWCDHLESFSDYENRLPRGRSYVRNGSVCHLAMAKGRVEAKVSGSELYDVKVTIKTLPSAKWTSLKGRCSGEIGSLLELLQGRLSDRVMEVVTHREQGLFPLPGEMSFTCSCPDSARMCKHVAAVLYGVGARLDDKPELLFALRGVDHEELIAADAEKAVAAATSRGKSKRLADSDLGEVFGIELAPAAATTPAEPSSVGPSALSPNKKSVGPSALSPNKKSPGLPALSPNKKSVGLPALSPNKKRPVSRKPAARRTPAPVKPRGKRTAAKPRGRAAVTKTTGRLAVPGKTRVRKATKAKKTPQTTLAEKAKGDKQPLAPPAMQLDATI